MSGLFGSTTIKGTHITDFSASAVSVGEPIPWGYGAFPVTGKIGFANLPPAEHRHVEEQGKGGVKQETFTYTLSYAIFLARCEVDGFMWIKRNGKVVYTNDPNAPIEDQDYAAKWAERVNFHYGTLDQLPDSLIESIKGTGNVSAFRGWCYFTIEDEDVTDVGGAVPTYEACVIVGGVGYLTTVPYPISQSEPGVHPKSNLTDFHPNPLSVPVEPGAVPMPTLTDFVMLGGEVNFTQPPEPGIVPTEVNLTNFEVAGGEIEHDQPAEPGIVPTEVGLAAFVMTGGEVTYVTRETGLAVSGISLTDFTMV